MKAITIAFAMAIMVADTLFAMPTEAEIAGVQSVVEGLVKGDYEAMKSGRKTADQVAETLIGYMKDAESEAAKYLLISKAFDLYIEAGNTKKAIDTVWLAGRTIRNFRDNDFHARIGYAFAAKGNWEYALSGFKRAGGRLAEVAKWEEKYPETGITELTTDAVGDFWWERAEENAGSPKIALALRIRSARWLKEALRNGSLRGLKRTLAQKRIAEVESGGAVVEPPKTAAASETSRMERGGSSGSGGAVSVAKGDWVAASAINVTKPAGNPITLNLGKGAKVTFIGCPAGEFLMGHPANHDNTRPHFFHKVKITRPFWLAKYRVTHEMWNAYQKVRLTPEDKALGGMKCAHLVTPDGMNDFCEWVTKKCRPQLPDGYVVRPPTDAEWEYAYKGGISGKDSPYASALYGWFRGRDCPPLVEKVAVMFDTDVEPKLKSARVKYDDDFHVCIPVGTKQKNAWGLFDMLGPGSEMLQDCFDRDRLGRSDNIWGPVLQYADMETDPLRYCSDPDKSVLFMRRGGDKKYPGPPFLRTVTWDSFRFSFRLCIGPNLIKEKGLKARESTVAGGRKYYGRPDAPKSGKGGRRK